VIVNTHKPNTTLYNLCCKASHGLISKQEYFKALKDGKISKHNNEKK